MSRSIVINVSPAETRVAILEEERLSEIFVERAEKDRRLGEIRLGKVIKVARAVHAAFVNVGIEADGFLPFADCRPNLLPHLRGAAAEAPEPEASAKRRRQRKDRTLYHNAPISEGELVPVQIVKEPISTKGARLSMQLSLPGRYMVLIPHDRTTGVSRRISQARERKRLKEIARELRPEGCGVIIRTIAEGHTQEELQHDLNELLESWERIQRRLKTAQPGEVVHRDLGMVSGILRDLFTKDIEHVVVDNRQLLREVRGYLREVQPTLVDRIELFRGREPVFDHYGVEPEIEKSLERRVWLKGGGSLVIEHTEALVSIDVNSGRFARKNNLEENALRVNLEAAREICRQLRLRDLGGLVVIDFIDMQQEDNRRKLETEMKGELRKDRAQTDVAPLSRFGLLEMTRERVRPALIHTLHQPCGVCGGTGMVPSRDTVISELERWIRRFRVATGERRLEISVAPGLHEYLTTGLRSPVRIMMWRNLMRIILKKSEQLEECEYRCYSLKQGKDLTAVYARGVGTQRMLAGLEEEQE